VSWLDEILGTNWKHRALKPSTFFVPSIIGWTCDKTSNTHYFVPALIAGIVAAAAMVYKNIGDYDDSKHKRKQQPRRRAD
jgi:hypothetical protein